MTATIGAPAVSVGMPVYNDEQQLPKALDGILAQTHRDFELILSDNASTDGSTEICRSYAARDQRIRFIPQPANCGAAANLNIVLREARGEYFMWAASDDEWDVTFIETLFQAIASQPECALAFCPYVMTDVDGRWISPPRVHDYSSPNRLARIIKLTRHWDDGCFYGMYRRRCLEGCELPILRWVDANRQCNNAYPVIYQALAAGNFVLAGSRPLWFNRIAPKSGREFPPSVAMLVRWKANVLALSLRHIHRGSGSAGLMLAAVPVLTMRFLYDCLVSELPRTVKRKLPQRVRALVRTIKRRIVGAG